MTAKFHIFKFKKKTLKLLGSLLISYACMYMNLSDAFFLIYMHGYKARYIQLRLKSAFTLTLSCFLWLGLEEVSGF